ncbi:MAG: hypothetical protein ACKVHX_13815 [Alphaproteobacteria bacterium]
MRVKRFRRKIFGVILLLSGWTNPALAQVNSTSTSLVPGPLVAIFAVSFIAAAAALIYSIKVRRLTAENAALSSELALRDARGWLRQEQAILWPFDKDIEIVSAGFASSLDIQSSDDSQFSSFL